MNSKIFKLFVQVFLCLFLGILLSIAEVFISVCRNQGASLKVSESKFDKKRSKVQPNEKSLTLKRTLSSSSRTEADHKIVVDNRVNDKRLSRSLSDLDVVVPDSTEKKPIIPEIKVETADNSFLQYHQKYSPTSLGNTTEPKFMKDADVHGFPKSASENNISKYKDNRDIFDRPTSKMDAFFQKTKSALGNVGPKLRDMSSTLGKDGSSQIKTKEGEITPRKTPFQKFNDKLVNRNDVKNPLKMFPDFKNKIQSALNSPRNRRKVRVLTEEEKLKRKNCRSKIIEL